MARQIGYQRRMHLSRPTATAIGFIAVLLWSLLAVFTAASGAMPPFQLMAITFGIGGLAGVTLWAIRPSAATALRQPWPVWMLGWPNDSGASDNVIARAPLRATRRTSCAASSGSQSGESGSGMKRPGCEPAHSSMCQSL